MKHCKPCHLHFNSPHTTYYTLHTIHYTQGLATNENECVGRNADDLETILDLKTPVYCLLWTVWWAEIKTKLPSQLWPVTFIARFP